MTKRRHEVWGFTVAALILSQTAMAATDSQGYETGDGDMTPIVAEPITPPVEAPASSASKVDAGPSDTTTKAPEIVEEKPVPDPVKMPAETSAEATPTKVAEPSPSGDMDEAAQEAALASPTRSIEAYEEARLERIHRDSIPSWGFNFTIAPRAFTNADARVPIQASDLAVEKPGLIGIVLSGEKVLFSKAGLISAGLQGGGYGSTKKEPFKGLLPGFLSLGPYLQYQANFLRRQWVVPMVAFEYEFVRYGYSYNNKNIRGFRGFPRFDLGAMLFLNFLEPSSAGHMAGNYGIKRTYLTVALSMVSDSSKQDMDFSEKGLRAGLRFEY